MAPCTPITPRNDRKRLSNDDKLKMIEESKKPGFCRKKQKMSFPVKQLILK